MVLYLRRSWQNGSSSCDRELPEVACLPNPTSARREPVYVLLQQRAVVPVAPVATGGTYGGGGGGGCGCELAGPVPPTPWGDLAVWSLALLALTGWRRRFRRRSAA